ncbi:MAG: hypothetical protein IKC36_05875 [Clostridia bacterium]|nr:hypothetical protein [Clostridia bacterium]
MRTANLKSALFRALTCVFLLFACFYALDFYKSLSGFIASAFREADKMLPMILSFLLPVISFFIFIYDFYAKGLSRDAKITVSVLGAVYAVANIAFIFSNISLYASNARHGVYDALPSIIIHFPYDMIAVHILVVALCAFNVICALKPSIKPCAFVDSFKQNGMLRLATWEYVLLCVLAITVFVFTGAGITAIFTSLSNAAYDFKFIFLVLWTMLVPMMNLLVLALKPESSSLERSKKIATLIVALGVNILFSGLFLIFELAYPSFIVQIGKPLYTIAFSVSLPIEMAVIFIITAIGFLSQAVKLVLLLTQKTA